MQAEINPLIIIDMYFGFNWPGALLLLQIGPDDVVRGSWRHALRELSLVIGRERPLRPFLVGATDVNGDAVRGMVVRIPYGAEQ